MHLELCFLTQKSVLLFLNLIYRSQRKSKQQNVLVFILRLIKVNIDDIKYCTAVLVMFKLYIIMP